MRLLRSLLLSMSTAVLAVACHSSTASTAPRFREEGMRVLFVGNSLTYTNALPTMVERLARQAGHDSMHVAMVAFPDFSLEDHWIDGTARQWMAAGRWEYVVLQQGSSALPASQVHLSSWAARFAPIVRAAGAEPVLFMVWPSQARLFDFPNVRDSYRNAAAGISAVFAPGGDAWSALGDYAPLYADGLHPTPAGTYLAALVLLERLTGTAPTSLPPEVPGFRIDSSTVRALQRAAAAALSRNPRLPHAAP